MTENQQLISLKPGTLIAGRYEVVKCLGAGSMGLVYACRHKELAGKIVAVKVLFPEVAQDKVAAARFKNEIQAAYGVSHPNVVRAYEFIKDGSILAYTMEYVGGGDVAEKLSDLSKLLPVEEILSIAIQMGQGVQSIHEAGIVHRDLKPENILLTKDGQVKIADFGIAKAGDGPRLTEHGGVVGTIQYVSPEYMLNAQVDWRSDIYAMGVLLYEMLTGATPYKADSLYSTLSKSLNTDPDPPSALRPDCPEDLDPIVLKAMRRDPELRYQSAKEMTDDLISIFVSSGFKSRFILQFPENVRSNTVHENARLDSVTNLSPVGSFENQAIETDFESVKQIRKTATISRGKKKSDLLDPPDPSQTILMDVSAQQLESVLSGEVSVYESWDKPGVKQKIAAPAGKLEEPEYNTVKSGVDKSYFLTLGLALIVGISVGLGVLFYFQPEVFGNLKSIIIRFLKG